VVQTCLSYGSQSDDASSDGGSPVSSSAPLRSAADLLTVCDDDNDDVDSEVLAALAPSPLFDGVADVADGVDAETCDDFLLAFA
jgi:hypothetical protein